VDTAWLFGDFKVLDSWLKLFKVSWVLVCAVASVTYFVVCMIGDFAKEERGMGFEHMYHEGRAIIGEEVESSLGSGASDVEIMGVSADKKVSVLNEIVAS
jgi:hypothetical protein